MPGADRGGARAAPTTFAYPNGGFDADTVAEVRRQGFDTAFSTIEGVNGRATDWMAVRRVGLGLGRDDFAWQVSGLWARRTDGLRRERKLVPRPVAGGILCCLL